MSTVAGGPDWWQASDGKWYPSELHPYKTQESNRSASCSDTVNLLATDQERDEAVETLGGALTSGQLTFDEYNERIQAVLEARTRRDIDDHLRDIGQPIGTPARRKVRPGFLLACVVVLGLGLASASWMAFAGSNCVRPDASEAACLVAPPANATLSSKEFSVGQTPKADYLGDKKVLTAEGSGSQTTPTFILDGGVLTYSAGGGGAYFYVVPVGQQLDVSKPPSWQVPQTGSGNVVATVPSVGKYRLYILAAAGTQWSVTLREFWLTPNGVTRAASSVAPVAGQTLVEVRGQGDYRSPIFRAPGR